MAQQLPSPDAAHLDSATSKVIRRTVVLFAVMFLFNQMDRSNIGFVREHLEVDLGISAGAYGLGAGIFFIAYFIFEVPSVRVLERVGPKIWITRICVTWGLISACMVFVQGEWSFYLVRFLLGAAEAGFTPAVVYYIGTFLPNNRRGHSIAIFNYGTFIGLMTGALISGPLLSMHGFLGISGANWMFLIEGLGSVVVGIVGYFLLDKNIDDAKWLTAPERAALQESIAQEAQQTEQIVGDRPSLLKIIARPRTILFAAIMFAQSLMVYAATFWLPSMVGQISGTSVLSVGFLSAIPWLCALVSMIIVGNLGDRFGHRAKFLAGALVLTAVASTATGASSPVWGLVFTSIAAMGVATIAISLWPILHSQVNPVVVGTTIAVVNSIANLGGFTAPYAFGLIKEATGQVQVGFFGLAAYALFAACLVPLLRRRSHTSPSADGVDTSR